MTSSAPQLLAQRIALVTGGGGGIGAAIASGLAEHGASVVVVGTTWGKLEHTVERIRSNGGQAWAYALNVADRAACHEVAKVVARDVGPVSVLVNNAGVIRYAKLDDQPVDQAWSDVIETNLTGPFNMVRAFLEPLKVTRGAIVNVGSIAGFIYTNNTVAYTASKGGLHSLTIAMARELGPHGVRVNTVAPGAVNTSMSPSASDATRLARLLQRVPLGRIGEPADIVGPVVFLASPMSAYVTGATLVVDGGYLTN
jgi:NAD(P)-dependent dehydrogenase (short-subunit alcohol dehydrogenase family)